MSDLSERAREIFNSWNNPPSPELPKGAGIVLELAERIAELEAALARRAVHHPLEAALEAAIAAEREACAQIADRWATIGRGPAIAAAIRARGSK